MDAVRAFVAKLSPTAEVHTTTYSRVPLPAILDVVTSTVTSGMGHEGQVQPLLVSSTPGSHRHTTGTAAQKERMAAKASEAAASGGTQHSHASHLKADEFVSLTYASVMHQEGMITTLPVPTLDSPTHIHTLSTHSCQV